MKKKGLLSKLFTILLSLTILTPEFSTTLWAANADSKVIDVSAAAPAILQEEPTPSADYEAPAVIEEEPLFVEGALPEGIDASNITTTPLEEPQETLNEKTKKIKSKYPNYYLKKQGESSKPYDEPSLSKEQIKELMIQGANIEDIYEIAYLSVESGVEPPELLKRKQKSPETWDQLRQSLKSEKKDKELKEKDKGKGSVSEDVYGTDQEVSPIDLSEPDSEAAEEVTVSDSVYDEIEEMFLNSMAATTMSTLDYNVNSVISDFKLDVINQTHKPQFSDLDPSSEIIDPLSGSLTWKDTQISLPGRDGLDLNIGIMYNSNLSSFYDMSSGSYNHNNTKFDLGTGWGFRFPSLEYSSGSLYYHDGEGSVNKVIYQSENPLEIYSHLKGYKGKDKRFVDDSQGLFSNGQDRSRYYIEYADKKREYFGGYYNNLLGIVDRYGNTITFNYGSADVLMGDDFTLLSSITDSTGRTVRFQYDTIDNRSVGEGEQRASENLTVSVLKADGTVSERVTYARKRVGHYLTTVYSTGEVYRYWLNTAFPVLESITDQSGSQITFNYIKDIYYYNMYNKTLDPRNATGAIAYMNLTTVNYPHARTKYEYDFKLRNYGPQGVIGSGVIKTRYDELRKLDIYNEKYNSVDYTYTTEKYNSVNYTYNGSYDAYPLYYEQDNYPADFTYSSVTNQNHSNSGKSQNLSISRIVNGKGQMLFTETAASNGEKTVVKNTAFHSLYTQSPTQSETWEYGVGDSDSSANKLYTETNYDDWGSVINVTRPLTETQRNDGTLKAKYTTTFTYEPNFHFLSSSSWYQNGSDVSPLTELYTYTSSGRLQRYTNAKNEVTDYTYLSAPIGDNLISSAIAETKWGSQTISKSETVYGIDTNYTYPTLQQAYMNIGKPDQQVVKKTTTYDMNTGRVIQEKDGDEKSTSFEYDILGRVKKITHPEVTSLNGEKYSDVEEFNYTKNMISSNLDTTNAGIQALKVDTFRTRTQLSNGRLMKTYRNALYNGLGMTLLEEQWDEYLGKWTFAQYHYDDLGRPIYAIDQAGNTMSVGYDAWGRQNSATDAFNNLYVSEYILKDRKSISYMTGASGGEKLNYVEQNYDSWGNVIGKQTYKDWPSQTQKISESYRYDIAGNLIAYTDPNNNKNDESVTSTYKYDALNRLISVKDALNQSTSYTYDGNGQISNITVQAKGGTPQTLHSKQYNELGLLTDKKDASSMSETVKYNNLGLAASKVDRNGTTFGFKYDEQQRLTTATLSGMIGGLAVTQESRMILGNTSLGVNYNSSELYKNGVRTANQTALTDSLGQFRWMDSQANGYSSALNLTLNAIGQVTKQISTRSAFGDFYTHYTYEKTRVATVQTNGASTLTTSDTANVEYQYEVNGQIKSVIYPKLSDGSILKTNYTYNKALGWVNTVTNTKGTTVLSSYEYGYDNNGNITTKKEKVGTAAVQSTSYTYDGLNRLLTITRSDGSMVVYTYDVKGNRQTVTDTLTMTDNLSTVSYAYDLTNTLTSVSKDTTTTSFDYMSDGLRYQKTTGSVKTQYGYNSNGEVISETKGSSKATYVRGDRLLVKKDLSTAGQTKDYYYLYNGHGDVVQMVDASGAIVNSYVYDEWGNITNQTEGVQNSFKYAGEIYDEETGLYYLRARYYDPSIGRFINEDTYEGQITNPLSLNLYSYVYSNPLRYIDPSGNVAVDPFLFKYNVQINQEKINWAKANENNDKMAMQAAAKEADRLRSEFMKLTVNSPEKREGLIQRGDKALLEYNVTNQDSTKATTLLVANNGTVYYEANPNYDFYEEVHTYSKTEEYHARAGKAIVGYGGGAMATFGKTIVTMAVTGSFATGVLEFMPGIPQAGATKTMIYRTNSKTGGIENMIIDTDGAFITNARYWKVYK